MLSHKLHANVLCFVHFVDRVLLRRSSFFTERKGINFFPSIAGKVARGKHTFLASNAC